MLRITHPEILGMERFGAVSKTEGCVLCFCCGKVLEEGFLCDASARTFCSDNCKKIYYER